VSVIFGFILIPIPIPAFVMIGVWILIQVFFGWASLGVDTASGGVAYFAHIGGFVAGAALLNLFVLGRPRRGRVRRRTAQDFW
jgi:membrane associated rhomboid family serine protease